MATFRKRSGPGGRIVWQAQIIKKGYTAQYATFDTKAQATKWATSVERDMNAGVFVSRTEAERTNLAEALDRYEREVTPGKRGVAQEASVVAVWRSHPLSTRSLAAIRSQDLAGVRDQWIHEGLQPATIARRFAVMSHLLTVARREWGMSSLTNPVHDVRLPRVTNARSRRLVDDEESRLTSVAEVSGREIGSLIRWAIETAMRRGEIAAMRWEHLDRKASVLLVPETKAGTPRRVPLSTRAMAILESLPRRLDGKVWSMRPDSITRAFERVCTAAGVTGLTFHDLRHEATSRLFEKGLNPMQVAAITGHKTLQMLKRYTHLRAEDLVGMLG
ncbi:MAG: site-specific integrase [Acidiferrobacteraceae bacterium]